MTLHGEMPIYGGLVPLGFQVEAPCPHSNPARHAFLHYTTDFSNSNSFLPHLPPGKSPHNLPLNFSKSMI